MSYFSKMIRSWDNLWFLNVDTIPLEVIRLGVGITLCLIYIPLQLDDVLLFYSNDGPVTLEYVKWIGQQPYLQSVFYYVTDQNLIIGLHIFFISSILAFTVGWKTQIAKWIVLFAHISYVHRNPTVFYGVDNILCNLLIILCFSPIGYSLSYDSVVRTMRNRRLNIHARITRYKSIWACASLRLMQIQMAICYFFAGAKKLQGDVWWSGEALWYALINFEFSNLPLTFFAEHFWIINCLTYFAIVLELSYPFLIWGEKSRPFFLSGAILLHLGIAIFLGLYLFAFAMIVGHMSFFRRRWYSEIYEFFRRSVDHMEIVYDGNCNFCLSTLSKISALDGFNQIEFRNYRANPMSTISFEMHDADLYLICKDRVYKGYYAYKAIVTKVPSLWMFLPFFYIPIISAYCGERIYRYIADNRMSLSACPISTAK